MSRAAWASSGRAVLAVGVAAACTGASLFVVAWLNGPELAEASVEPSVSGAIVVAPPPQLDPPAPREQTAPQPVAPAAAPVAPDVPPPSPPQSALAGLDNAARLGTTWSTAGLPGLGIGDPGQTAPLGSGPVGAPPVQAEPDAVKTTPARPLARPTPPYPRAARRAGIEGHVTVRLRVDRRGRVTDVVIVSADPPGVFNEVAKKTAGKYRFAPARRGGVAVETTVEQRIVFQR